MSLSIDDIKVGDVLKWWHDAGCMGAEFAYARVVKLGKKKVYVTGENGRSGWKYPRFYDKCSDSVANDMKELFKW